MHAAAVVSPRIICCFQISCTAHICYCVIIWAILLFVWVLFINRRDLDGAYLPNMAKLSSFLVLPRSDQSTTKFRLWRKLLLILLRILFYVLLFDFPFAWVLGRGFLANARKNLLRPPIVGVSKLVVDKCLHVLGERDEVRTYLIVLDCSGMCIIQ